MIRTAFWSLQSSLIPKVPCRVRNLGALYVKNLDESLYVVLFAFALTLFCSITYISRAALL
jgi:hypothetical protein